MNSAINTALFFVFLALLIATFALVNVAIKRFSTQGVSVATLQARDSTPKVAESIVPASWLNLFSSKEITHFSYPSSELFIWLDFSKAQKTDILSITNLDSYKFFCLNQVLKNNNIQFTYQKSKDSLILEVALRDDDTRKRLISELRKYNISYTIR